MVDVIGLYCLCDDFSKVYKPALDSQFSGLAPYPCAGFSLPELMTVLVSFHYSGMSTLKSFYRYLESSRRSDFPGLPSYSRFVELIPWAVLPLYLLGMAMGGPCGGTSYIDSTRLIVCSNKRIRSHQVFKDIAKLGKSSMGWFFGFKLHLVISDDGRVMAFTVTAGNVDDRRPVPGLLGHIWGKVFGDRGYLGKDLFEGLMRKGLRLITPVKRNMRPAPMELEDSKKLSKRSLIESVFNTMKNRLGMEHTRHRSPKNYLAHIFGTICAYAVRFIYGVGDGGEMGLVF